MKTILVVDDEEGIRERGYRVLTAGSGQEALEVLLQEAGLRLVITDLKHAAPDGRKLLRRIKQEWPKLPVIINSANAAGRKDPALFEAEAYAVKDADLTDLFDAVDRVLTDSFPT